MQVELTDHVAFQERSLGGGGEAAGRRGRFASLVERQSRFAFGVAFAVLRNPDDAEDVVQDAFLKLYRGNAWEAMKDERAFLARVVWRMAVDRRPRVRHEELDAELASAGASPESAAVEADRDALVHKLIDSLPEELRQTLALSAVEEMNSRQIAEAMGIAEGTVRTRLMRAREILREKLAKRTGGRDAKRGA